MCGNGETKRRSHIQHLHGAPSCNLSSPLDGARNYSRALRALRTSNLGRKAGRLELKPWSDLMPMIGTGTA